jgi:alcohol dehydrogenase (cytochrome c)
MYRIGRSGRLLRLGLLFGYGLLPILGMADPATPDRRALLGAQADSSNWLLPASTYAGNRFTTLAQINKTNVGMLSRGWQTTLLDDGEQEAAVIVWKGTMFVATPHGGVLALDAATGKLRWHSPYSPSYVLLFAVNRGVGVADGKVFIATQDCRIRALDAGTGKPVWDVQGCVDTSNSWYSMAAYVYKDQIIVGTGGGDNGNIGLVSSFSVADGKRLWDWRSIPGPGEPGHDSWPGDSWQHGGGAVWNGLSIDQETDTLFVTPGNPGPDMVLGGRQGRNLYTDSLVALDISGKKPRMKWYYQLIQNDTHDADPAMVPVLFEGSVAGVARHLVAVGDKAGNFVILDRSNGAVVHRMILSTQKALDTPPTAQGIEACPNHGGGIEWNGGAYDPATNLFLVPSTEECGIFKLASDAPPQYIPGQPYAGGALPKRRNGTGVLSAVDINTGKLRWRNSLPFPAEGGVLITSSGLAFTSDVGGNVYAFDAATGHQYWKSETGSSIVAPISAYNVNGTDYLALVVGEAGNQQTPNLPATEGSRVIAYRLGEGAPIENGTEGQLSSANAPNGLGGESGGPPEKSVGSAPYTSAQAARGGQIYAKECAVCHGANLQGVSAPALTGPSFGRSHLNGAQLRTVVVDTMPLTAPGSLKPDENAAVIAYLLSYNCVQAAGDGRQELQAAELPELQHVELGSASCPPK